jgi:hypothetical protein
MDILLGERLQEFVAQPELLAASGPVQPELLAASGPVQGMQQVAWWPAFPAGTWPLLWSWTSCVSSCCWTLPLWWALT